MKKAITSSGSWWRLLTSQPRASCHPLPMTNLICEKYASLTRVLQMHSEGTSKRRLFTESAADSSSESSCCSSEVPSGLKADAQNTVNKDMMSKLKTSPRHDLAMVFTCKVCETRQMKSCCRESYEKGVVVVRCDGCDNLHLIADRLGWFGEPGSIEDLLAAREELVKKGPINSLNLTLEDLAGKKF
ncbi:DNL-type zinc finger protein-like [Chenopodium quinoa]|uniref:DNL-type zinc finger protein-like n=1 Tax=Chenopodium quinoa TaxID=63459 RepID=UPI000B7939E3|nr:DNL-type zinc finger protein-like [Chenopodium quinoa]